MKKLLLIITISLICIGLVSAAWYFIIGGNVNANVKSIGSYKEAILNFNDIQLDTTNSSDKAGSQLEFVYNREGTFRVDILETISDLSNGECKDGITDCNTIYTLFDGEKEINIRNEQTIVVPENNERKKIIVNMSCVAYSCPQNRDISIRLNQVA